MAAVHPGMADAQRNPGRELTVADTDTRETTTEAPAARKGGGGAGLTKKLGPLPVWAWALGGGALIGGVFYLRRKANGGNASTTSNASTAGGSSNLCVDPTTGQTAPCTGGCTDANGQAVPCTSTDTYTSDLITSQYNTLSSQIAGLQAGEAVESTPSTTPPPAPTPTPSTTPTSTPCSVTQYGAPGGLQVQKTGSGTATVRWNTLGGSCPPASYTVAFNQLNGKLAYNQTTSCPDTTGGKCQTVVGGLHPGWSYNVRVWANGGKVAPPSANGKVTV